MIFAWGLGIFVVGWILLILGNGFDSDGTQGIGAVAILIGAAVMTVSLIILSLRYLP